jgi:diguanylate cyclase (GGDEF)-like protein/PAS domain S-box-containing protein
MGRAGGWTLFAIGFNATGVLDCATLKLRMPRSLASRLFFLFAAIQLGVLGLGLGMSAHYQLKDRFEDTRRTAELVTGVVAQAVAGSLVDQGAAAIRPVLMRAVDSETLQRASFVDASGQRMTFNATGELFVPAPAWVRDYVAMKLPRINLTVSAIGRDAGVLRLDFAVDRIAAELWEGARQALLLALAGLVAGLAVTHLMLRHWLGSLANFGQVASRIRAGMTDATAEIDQKMPLEFRLAAEKLNSATASLRDQFGQRIDVLMDALIQHKGAVDRSAIVSELDASGTLVHVNDMYCAVSGRSRDDVVGRDWAFMCAESDARDHVLDRVLDANVHVGDVCNLRPDGTTFWLHSTRVPIFAADGKLEKYICIDFDISERKESEEKIRRLAYFDALTGLPNRRHFFEQVEAHIAHSGAEAGGFAILHFDLYNFKDVNDTLGHAAGDELLVDVGRRVSACLGTGDFVARVGGDEFAVLVPGAGSAAVATGFTERIFDVLEEPFRTRGGEMYLSSSMGVSLFPGDGDDVTRLLKHADMALYRAKARGKRACVYFSSELERNNRERADMERELRGALERGELSLEYQPKYHLGYDRVVGAEALLRWNHPVLGRVPPVRFIPVAEESQLIIPIGKWVIEEVCRQIQRWENAGLPPIQVALNLSAVQFRSAHLFEEIAAILARADVLPGQIELEITESLLMDDPSAAVELLGRLRQAGFSIAIDDFGTGYSSLSYLKKFPVGVLKIDRSFVKDLSDNMDDRAIAAAVVSMAGSLLLDVVAEGVETIEQVDILRDMGCDYIQGYYISKPMAPDAFEQFVRVSHEHGIEVARIPAQTQAPHAIQPAGSPVVADVTPL